MQWRLRPETQAAGQARRDAVQWLSVQGLPCGTLDDIAVVLAELLANAVHVARDLVVLDVTTSDDACHIAVTDDGPGFGQLPPDALPPYEAEGSRGLFLVRTLSNGFTVQTGATGTTVRCWLAISAAAVPGSAGPGASASPVVCRPGR